MKAPHHDLALRKVASDLESDVSRISAWGAALAAIGNSGRPVDAAAILVVAGALVAVADDLRENWEELHQLSLAK